MDNLSEYIRLVIEWTLVKGVKPMTSKFKEGFNEVFAVADLHTFTPEELVKLFGDEDEDWSFGTISESIKADHGYSLASNAIVNFVELISSFDNAMRRKALSFFTGASRLPVGGFKGLNPQLTIVRKIPDTGLRADDVLPSVMTCANFIKLCVHRLEEDRRHSANTLSCFADLNIAVKRSWRRDLSLRSRKEVPPSISAKGRHQIRTRTTRYTNKRQYVRSERTSSCSFHLVSFSKAVYVCCIAGTIQASCV